MAFDSRLLAGIGVLAAVVESGNFAKAAKPEFAVHRHGDDNILIRHIFLPKKTAS